MGYIEQNLAPEETVVYRTGCHWIVMLWPLAVGAVMGFSGSALFAGGWLATRNGGRYYGALVEGAMLLMGASALVVGGIIRRLATELAVSNQRVFLRTGLFNRKSIAVLLPRVESVGMKETFAGRILGYGTVVVRGTGGSFETFERIREPNEFRRQIQGQLSKML